MSRREIRIALVIEGGVSLAVWMSGVAHELDLLRRAGSGDRPPVPSAAEDSATAQWRALCDDLDVDVVVDVVAGTSAGGLNGALLACAIASGEPLPGLKELWMRTAQLKREFLLHADGEGPLPSLLDGRFFAEQLRSVFASALGVRPDGQVPAGPARGARPVTLLTTATALGQQLVRWTDSSGRPFDVADHRRVYRFRHDPTRLRYVPPDGAVPADVLDLFEDANPAELAPARWEAVARAARATAGFPGAFEPVDERDDTVDLGPFRLRANAEYAPLVDGGVLDNAPFEPLVEEIARREVEGDWRRVIGYIVANDGLVDAAVSTDGAGGVSAASAPAREWFPVMASTLRMPTETSFRHGVQALAQAAASAERLVAGPEQLFQLALDDRGPAASAVEPLYGLYRPNRLASGLVDAANAIADRMDARSLGLPRRPDANPDDAPDWVPPPTFAAALAAADWRWGTAVAERGLRLLVQDLHGRYAEPGEPPTDQADTALATLSRVLTAVEAVRDFVADRVATPDPDQLDRPLLDTVNEAVAAARSPVVLHELMSRALTAYAAGIGSPGTEPSVLRAVLTVEVVTQSASGRMPFNRPARFDTVRMGPDVGCPTIESVPRPGRPGPPRAFGEWKLYGTQLGHFGAFGLPEWREHDYVWGRLDGAAHLVRLVVAASGTTGWDDDAVGARVVAAQRAVLAEEGVDAERMRKALEQLSGLDAGKTLDAIRLHEDGRTSLEDTMSDLFRMLRIAAKGTPSAVTTAGEWASATLARRFPQGPSRVGLEGAARLGLVRRRRRLWRWVRWGGWAPD